MAFHPFRHFRKHQKVFFAVMLIVCMITFVFSGFGSSGADPFQNALRWIGMSRHQGDEVLPLYGKTIHTEDLDKIRMRRQLASEFLKSGVLYPVPSLRVPPPLESVLTDIQKRIESDRKEAGDNLPSPLAMAFQEWNGFRFGMLQAEPDKRQDVIRASLQTIQKQLANPEVQKNDELSRSLDGILMAVSSQAWFWTHLGQQPQEYYFGGTPRTEDMLDFEVWKHQADKLGIVLTAADVGREVNRAWGNGDFFKKDGNFDNNEWVRKFFGSNSKIHKNLNASDLLSALTDEFRVAMAREAIVGSGAGVRFYRTLADDIHHSPAVATPDEFLKFFQERRTAVVVSMLPVSVENFVSKVTVEPTEQDLKELYNRCQNDEPSPALRPPGFKEPRRIKVEYFSYRLDGPFAKKLAAKATELLPLFRLGGPANTLPAGGGVAWAASLAASADLDTVLRGLYEEYRQEEADRVLKYDTKDDDPFRSHFGQGFDLNDRRSAEVQPAIAALGQLLGDVGTGGTPLGTPITWLATNQLYERATLSAFASTVLASAGSSPFVAVTVPTRYLYSAQPLEVVRKQLVERFEEKLARETMTANVLAVRLELDKLLLAHSEQKCADYVKKAVADHGLEHFHAMTSMQTRQEMLDHPDAALKELQTAYQQSMDTPFPQERRPDFVSAMFRPLDRAQPDRPKLPIRTQQFFSTSRDVGWVFWRSDDKAAHTLKFETIRAEVEKAWKFEQAHKLAGVEARRINEELKKQHVNADDAVKFLRDQKQGEVFRLSNVAHLIPRPNAFVPLRKMSPNDFVAYRPDKNDIAYPPADFVDKLLKLKEAGDSLVMADQPVKHFYVTVLMGKPQKPDLRQFYDIYSFSGPSGNPMWTDMMNMRQQTYYQKLMEQMRAEATKKVEGGEYVIPPQIRNRSESSSNDSGE